MNPSCWEGHTTKEAITSTHKADITHAGTSAFSKKNDVYSSSINLVGKEDIALVTELS